MKVNKYVFAVMAVLMLIAEQVSAQVVDSAEDKIWAKPVSLLTENEENSISAGLEAFDPTISYYVQNLNLTPEQLDRAQIISEAEQEKKNVLLKQIADLRQEAYNLEAGSLIAFEAILDDDQKAAFRELRAEKQNIISVSEE